MYRRILLASDFSAPATAGARLARSLAAPDATFLAVHVLVLPTSLAFPTPALGMDPIPALGWSQSLRESGEATAERGALQAKLDDWIRDAGVSGVDGVVAEGDVTRTILQEAGDFTADLVVLGNRGHSRLDQVLLGSTARNVLRHARADVLLACEGADRLAAPPRIAVATSFDDASRAAARRAREIAEATGAQLVLLHAMGPGIQTGATYGVTPTEVPLGERTREIEEGVDARLDAFNHEEMGGRATILRGRGPLAHELTRLAQEGHADLLVLGHHHAGFFERLLLGSVSEALARHPPCSTLFVQA